MIDQDARKEKARRTGKKSKTKGNVFERWIAHQLSDATGKKFHRTPSSGGSGLAAGFRLAGDVVTDDRNWQFCIEAKARQGWILENLFSEDSAVWSWWRQACREAKTVAMEPLLVFKRKMYGPYVMMTLESLHRLTQGRSIKQAIVFTTSGEQVSVFLFSQFLDLLRSRKEVS